jgi:site-specific DNA-methyltransferase (adenine-specific)
VKPYYEKDGTVLYHGDAREILPALESDSIDLLLTDPPFPGLKGGTVYAFDGVAKTTVGTKTVGVPWDATLDWIAPAWNACRLGSAVFCSYHSVAEIDARVPGPSVALAVWYKHNSPPAIANVPRFTTEFIWLHKKKPGLKWRGLKNTLIDVPMPSAGCMAVERIVDARGAAVHPCQKPLRVISALLQIEPRSVLDPFAGTGTTLVAAKERGIRAIGIEMDERYCEITAQRLSQENLFAEVA